MDYHRAITDFEEEPERGEIIMRNSTNRLAAFILTLLILAWLIPAKGYHIAKDAIGMARDLVETTNTKNTVILSDLVDGENYDEFAESFATFHRLEDTLEDLISRRDDLRNY